MPTLEELEIAIFIATQTGLLIWILSDIRADLKNLNTWVTRLDARNYANGNEIAELRGEAHDYERK
jgi:hypothetical protein